LIFSILLLFLVYFFGLRVCREFSLLPIFYSFGYRVNFLFQSFEFRILSFLPIQISRLQILSFISLSHLFFFNPFILPPLLHIIIHDMAWTTDNIPHFTFFFFLSYLFPHQRRCQHNSSLASNSTQPSPLRKI